MKILICGDNFSADQTGWTNELSTDFEVTNLSKRGVNQYNILQQIRSVDLRQYEGVVLCNTDCSIDKESQDIYKLIDYEQDRILTWNWVVKIRNYDTIRSTVNMIDNTNMYVVEGQSNNRTKEDNEKIYKLLKTKLSKFKRHVSTGLSYEMA